MAASHSLMQHSPPGFSPWAQFGGHTELLLRKAGWKGAGEAACRRADFLQDFWPRAMPEAIVPSVQGHMHLLYQAL